MSKVKNFINNALTVIITVFSCAVILYLNNKFSSVSDLRILYLILGIILALFINTLFHELGHLILGKVNGFSLISISVWFFKWTKNSNKTTFSFILPSEESGATEMIPKSKDNIEKHYRAYTFGGILFSFILFIISIAFVLLYSFLPQWTFFLFAGFLPVSAYYFFGSILPMESDCVKNDGAIFWGIGKDDSIKVSINLLLIHSYLYNGISPSNIPENLYFDLPQIREDDLNFILLLNARYYYYLDKEDFINAKKQIDRLLSLEDYVPKSMMTTIKADALYGYCTFDYNETKADDFMYEVEKYLNNVNSLTNLRIKLAYLIYVVKDLDKFKLFYDKFNKDKISYPIKGIVKLEEKLIEKIKSDV